MITHKIIKNPITIPTVNFPVQQPQQTFSLPNYTKKIKDQTELDLYNQNTPHGVGDWITYSTLPLDQIAFNHLYLIIGKETDYKSLEFDHQGNALVFAVTNFPKNAEIKPFRHWATMVGMRTLHKYEFHKLVRPEHDFLQDRVAAERTRFLEDPYTWGINK